MGRLVDIQTDIKPLKKIGKNWDNVFFFRPAEFSGQLNCLKRWTDPARPGRNDLWRFISQILYKIGTWNFNILFVLSKFGISVFDSLKTMDFSARSNFGNFQQFFHHNFRLKWKSWSLLVPLGRSSSDLSESTLFQIEWNIYIYFYL